VTLRLEEELRARQQQEEDATAREKERRRKEKMAGRKAQLSFALDVRTNYMLVS
jgi:hypothetical protein